MLLYWSVGEGAELGPLWWPPGSTAGVPCVALQAAHADKRDTLLKNRDHLLIAPASLPLLCLPTRHAMQASCRSVRRSWRRCCSRRSMQRRPLTGCRLLSWRIRCGAFRMSKRTTQLGVITRQ